MFQNCRELCTLHILQNNPENVIKRILKMFYQGDKYSRSVAALNSYEIVHCLNIFSLSSFSFSSFSQFFCFIYVNFMFSIYYIHIRVGDWVRRGESRAQVQWRGEERGGVRFRMSRVLYIIESLMLIFEKLEI